MASLPQNILHFLAILGKGTHKRCIATYRGCTPPLHFPLIFNGSSSSVMDSPPPPTLPQALLYLPPPVFNGFPSSLPTSPTGSHGSVQCQFTVPITSLPLHSFCPTQSMSQLRPNRETYSSSSSTCFQSPLPGTPTRCTRVGTVPGHCCNYITLVILPHTITLTITSKMEDLLFLLLHLFSVVFPPLLISPTR